MNEQTYMHNIVRVNFKYIIHLLVQYTVLQYKTLYYSSVSKQCVARKKMEKLFKLCTTVQVGHK